MKKTSRPKKVTINKKAIKQITVKGLVAVAGGIEPGQNSGNRMP